MAGCQEVVSQPGICRLLGISEDPPECQQNSQEYKSNIHSKLHSKIKISKRVKYQNKYWIFLIYFLGWLTRRWLTRCTIYRNR